jgi:hypothetical protein
MLDYRLHYPTLVAEDRGRGARDNGALQNRGIRRIFRVGDSRPQAREMGRR